MFYLNCSLRFVGVIFFFAEPPTQKLQTEDEVHIRYYFDFDFIYCLLLVIHDIINVDLQPLCVS